MVKIGITLDHETSNYYANYPWYALRCNYSKSCEEFGAVTYMLPYNIRAIEEYVSYLDGLLITGGNFDIDPKYYGQDLGAVGAIKDDRTKFELELFNAFYKANKPILGICGGEQLINVALGGSLIQHIPNEIEGCIEHEQKTPKHQPSHEVELLEISKLYTIVGQSKFMVNSTHHQAVKGLGRNLIISALAPDGVIEAIECTKSKYCLGVEWHPEYLSTPHDKKLLSSFVNACQNDLKSNQLLYKE